MSTRTQTDDLTARLAELCGEFRVPGAAFAVAEGDETTVAWTGTANIATGMPVAEDTLFNAGSVTKVFTASLLMTLVDEGRVDLDALVTDYLPEFAEATDPRAAGIRVRMLLDHTSGLPGSVTFDIPRGPDVNARFVEHLLGVELNSPPGAYWSYSNGGLVVAGRVVEVVTGMTYPEALAERVLRPLGLNATSDPEQMLLQSTAVGHLVGEDGSVIRTPRFQLGTNAPSGSALACDIHALVAFARMHLNEGLTEDGTRVLSAASAARMREGRVDTPWGLGYPKMGLGWLRTETPAGPLLMHTGGSAGQHSCLFVLPERRGVLAALTNGINGTAVYGTLTARLLHELFGVPPAAPLTVPEEPVAVDHGPLTGVWIADEGQVTVDVTDGRLGLSYEVGEEFGETMRLLHTRFPPPPATLTPFAADGRFLTDTGTPVQFVTPEGADRPEYLYVGRIYRRAE